MPAGSGDAATPITVAIMNDYPVVVQGVAQMLSADPRLEVVELRCSVRPRQPVDVLLYDTFAAEARWDRVEELLLDDRYGRVLLFTWHTDEAYLRRSQECGVHGVVAKSVSAEGLAEAVVRAHRDGTWSCPGMFLNEQVVGQWPGRDVGLSPREAEVVALITQGETNQRIAEHCFLSINSVKSYIRSAYRKMGVERRSQAVRWGAEHGMLPPLPREGVEPPVS